MEFLQVIGLLLLTVGAAALGGWGLGALLYKIEEDIDL